MKKCNNGLEIIKRANELIKQTEKEALEIIKKRELIKSKIVDNNIEIDFIVNCLTKKRYDDLTYNEKLFVNDIFENATKEDLQILKDKGIDHLHVDVMDGQFVPSQAFGPNTVNDLKNMTDFKLDVHLMIENPEKHIPLYKNADIITVHYESTRHLYQKTPPSHFTRSD